MGFRLRKGCFHMLEVPNKQWYQIIPSSLWGKKCFHFKSEVPG